MEDLVPPLVQAPAAGGGRWPTQPAAERLFGGSFASKANFQIPAEW